MMCGKKEWREEDEKRETTAMVVVAAMDDNRGGSTYFFHFGMVAAKAVYLEQVTVIFKATTPLHV
jgi:hypothetical protein